MISKKKIKLFVTVLFFAVANIFITNGVISHGANPTIECIDSPATNYSTAISSTKLNISGWALSDAAVKQVKILVDNNFSGYASIGESRPDVSRVYPGYSDGSNSGYSYALDVSNLSAGSHKLTVETIGNNGTTAYAYRNFSTYTKKSMSCIDTPTQSSTFYSNQIKIVGWALNPSGLKSVQIYCDNNLKGQAQINQSRPDVQNVFKGYSEASTSGFSYTLDGTYLPSGSHIINVVSTGNDGSTQSLSRQINVAGLLDCVDSPQQNKTYGSSIKVSGWTLDPSGISKVQVYVNGNYVEDASLGQSRNDVAKVYPNYTNNVTSGYTASLDISSLSNGNHTITLKFIAANGDTDSKNVQIQKNVQLQNNLPAISYIDTPKGMINGSSKSVLVSGWALNSSGVKQVNVLVDNNQVGTAQIGYSRPDVANVFPAYNNTTSGYHYDLDVSSIGAGTHSLTIQTIGNACTSNSVSTSITRPDNMMYIDSPVNLKNVNSTISVSGWSLDITGTKEVDILVDGQNVGTATIGIARPDVYNAYPAYNIVNSGFSYSLDASVLSSGIHRITVNGIGNNGQVVSNSVLVTVGNLSIYMGADVYEGDDISDYQQFKSSGVRVVIQKATQGETFTDSLLKYRAANLTKYGFLVGYYHYANNDSQPDAQAQHFLDSISGLHSDTVLWLDIENEGDWSKQQAVAFTKEFINYVQARGYKIGIYSGLSFYNDYLADSNFNVPLWLASYGKQPSLYPSVSWQYTSTGTLSGVNGYIDLDWFNNLIFN